MCVSPCRVLWCRPLPSPSAPAPRCAVARWPPRIPSRVPVPQACESISQLPDIALRVEEFTAQQFMELRGIELGLPPEPEADTGAEAESESVATGGGEAPAKGKKGRKRERAQPTAGRMR